MHLESAIRDALEPPQVKICNIETCLVHWLTPVISYVGSILLGWPMRVFPVQIAREETDRRPYEQVIQRR
jgi:hypothetical protein